MPDDKKVRGEIEDVLRRLPSLETRKDRINNWIREKLNRLGHKLHKYGLSLTLISGSVGIIVFLMADRTNLAELIAFSVFVWGVVLFVIKASVKGEDK